MDEFTEDDVWGLTTEEEGHHRHTSSLGDFEDTEEPADSDTFASAGFETSSRTEGGLDISKPGPRTPSFIPQPASAATWTPTTSFPQANPDRRDPAGRRVSNPIFVPNLGTPSPGVSGSNKENSAFLPTPTFPHDENSDAFVPPHVLAASVEYDQDHIFPASAAPDCGLVTHSMTVGSGRTLKGRDAYKLRTAVMRHTGYLEQLEDTTTFGFAVNDAVSASMPQPGTTPTRVSELTASQGALSAAAAAKGSPMTPIASQASPQ